MPNPGGGNQFGNFTLQPPYGDVKRQTALTKESPISGSPFAAHALDTARRSQRQATRRSTATQAGPPPAPPAPQPAPMATPYTVAQTWQQLAAIPGANDAIRRTAEQAASVVQP